MTSRVLHLVSRLQPGGRGQTLWPTVLALADAGVPQSLVLMDHRDAAQARLMLPAGVRLGDGSAGSAGRAGLPAVRQAATTLRSELADGPTLAVHVHGLTAGLLGRHVLRGSSVQAPMFFHLDSDTLAARIVRGLDRSAFLVQRNRVDALDPSGREHPGGPSRPVDEVYFNTERAEAETPLIVTTGQPGDLVYAQAFVQLAVMLTGLRPALTFGWIGDATPAVQQMLQAAQIKLMRGADATDRAEALHRAWVYVSPDPAGSDARGMAEAMAAGVPCLGRQVPAYRALIVHALSGYLCNRNNDLIAAIARLVEAAPLRREMGQAARTRARHRHGRHRFRASMLLAHGLSPVPVLRSSGVAPVAAGAARATASVTAE
ncbi:glycosyltransferase [Sphaerotilus sp.]|uniref:glycosyltransferase n=1 Tax=Sphaerotilus sp. TaxID=2093942 RepID=UPI0034E238CB